MSADGGLGEAEEGGAEGGRGGGPGPGACCPAGCGGGTDRESTTPFSEVMVWSPPSSTQGPLAVPAVNLLLQLLCCAPARAGPGAGKEPCAPGMHALPLRVSWTSSRVLPLLHSCSSAHCISFDYN